MANSSSNFIKINNEYVKFYATTNSALPEILKNTGALIVVQDNSKTDENGSYIRSLWLANNFIAEGHGFSAAEMRDYYDSYAAIESNGERQLTNIIERLKFGIDENATNMQRYVLTQGGDISNTIISAYVFGNNDRQDIQSAYLTNILKPADYEDNYIHNVESYIEYNYYDTFENNKYVSTPHVSYATNIDKLNFNDRKITRDIIYDIPRGAEIQNAYLYLETINNSCNGFTADNDSNDYQNVPPVETSMFASYINTLGNDSRHVYNEETRDALKDSLYFQAHSYGTVKFKTYPNLPPEIEYISYENIIKEHTLTIGYIYCNIYDTVKYGYVNNYTNVRTGDIYGNGRFSRIYDTDNRYSYAVLDDVVSNKYMTFAIPANYEIVNVYQRRQYVANKRVAYYEYNVTGDTFELSYNDNNCSSTLSLLSVLKNSQVYVNNKNYILKNKIKDNDSIIISLVKNDVDSLEVSNIINEFNSDNYNARITDYFMQDSEYNSTHWFAPTELSYIQNTI